MPTITNPTVVTDGATIKEVAGVIFDPYPDKKGLNKSAIEYNANSTVNTKIAYPPGASTFYIYLGNQTNAANQHLNYDFMLTEGTYDFYLLYTKSANGDANTTIDFDDGNPPTVFDTTGANVLTLTKFSGIVYTTKGNKEIVITIPTSGKEIGSFSKIMARRVA